ncbi:nuclear transport factor 2 family protein [Pedococcus sp. 5OH_020]|uniref:nuclear transport factor 2 family protein n=1 Tax=Pedococcus sp. 5OH_020 TaxID=2989814 RepID=UPI0022EA06F5|nr:nuclear transport factor 2 family protein [Pedococcus sp. 5OH_020]
MTTNRPAADLLTDYYAAMESGDPAKFGSYYADDMTLTFGNSPTITGRQNVIDTMTTVLGTVRSLHHDLVNLWELDNGVVVYESVGFWNLFDGQQVAIPACTVLTIVEGKFTDQRIYVDNAPVDAALARERYGAAGSTAAM